MIQDNEVGRMMSTLVLNELGPFKRVASELSTSLHSAVKVLSREVSQIPDVQAATP